MLKPSGLTFKEFKEKRVLQGRAKYKSIREAGVPTPSKRWRSSR